MRIATKRTTDRDRGRNRCHERQIRRQRRVRACKDRPVETKRAIGSVHVKSFVEWRLLTVQARPRRERQQNVHRSGGRKLLRGGSKHEDVDRILHLDQEPLHGARNVAIVLDCVGRILGRRRHVAQDAARKAGHVSARPWKTHELPSHVAAALQHPVLSQVLSLLHVQPLCGSGQPRKGMRVHIRCSRLL